MLIDKRVINYSCREHALVSEVQGSGIWDCENKWRVNRIEVLILG